MSQDNSWANDRYTFPAGLLSTGDRQADLRQIFAESGPEEDEEDYNHDHDYDYDEDEDENRYPTLIQEGYAPQFGTACVEVKSTDGLTADEVINFARDIDAIYEADDTYYVVDFKHDPSRLVGPECFTAAALRGTIR